MLIAPITWEAFATLTTGFLAVGGAVWVGLRQAGISSRQAEIADRQTSILDRQAALQEVAVKADLFDRRLQVYSAANNFLVQIMREADEPKREVQHDFLTQLELARFLFRPQVHDGLQELWERASGFFALKKVMAHTYSTEGHYGDGNPEKELKVMTWFHDRLQSLPELFGGELRLGQEDILHIPRRRLAGAPPALAEAAGTTKEG